MLDDYVHEEIPPVTRVEYAVFVPLCQWTRFIIK